jgi:hypothetical protein
VLNSQTEEFFAAGNNWLKQDDTNVNLPLQVPKLVPVTSILLRRCEVAIIGYKNGDK